MEVRPSERVHLFGENGAGKSTLFKLITGLLRPDSGRVDVLGLVRPSPEKLKGRVGLLLQNPVRQLFENTVREEVSFALKRQSIPATEFDERVAESLAYCDIEHLAGRSPFTLSYGERHRVTIAAMIALRPRLLLLDEPFSGLDFAFRRRMLETLKAYCDRHDCAMIAASHDALPDPDWADRSFILKDGRLTGLLAA